MSLTQINHVFAGAHENAINDFLRAFLTARPRHINYGTSAFVPVTTASVTNVPVITFPGIPGGIQYMVQFSIPIVDFFPSSGTGALSPGPGELSIHTKVRITVSCRKGRIQDEKLTTTPLTTSLEVWAKGTIQTTFLGPGIGRIGFILTELKIPDLACVKGEPDTFEIVIECVIRMILQALLDNISIPFKAITIGFIQLILERGPEIDDDQIKMWGDIS
jgi:hypothetical protein